MAIKWTDEERAELEKGMAQHGINTGRCAALARITHSVARRGEPKARAIRLRPKVGGVYLVPKDPDLPYWSHHVYVETRDHAVDAITGPNGYSPASNHVKDHWEYTDEMRIEEVDPATVDRGIQDAEDES